MSAANPFSPLDSMELVSAPDDHLRFVGVPRGAMVVEGNRFYVRESEIDELVQTLREGCMQ